VIIIADASVLIPVLGDDGDPTRQRLSKKILATPELS